MGAASARPYGAHPRDTVVLVNNLLLSSEQSIAVNSFVAPVLLRQMFRVETAEKGL